MVAATLRGYSRRKVNSFGFNNMTSAAPASKKAERSRSLFLGIDHHRAPHPFAIDGANQKSENPKHPLRKEVGEKKEKLHEENDSQFCPWEQKVNCSKTPEQEGKLNEEYSAGTRDHYRHPVSWGIPVGYVAFGRGQDVGGIRV